MSSKHFWVILALLVSLPAPALEITFVGPCDSTPLASTSLQAPDHSSVGDLTIAVLSEAGHPFEGTAQGLLSAFGTPTGLDALEVVSDEELRAYGWCFLVNGQLPDLTADAVPVTQELREIRWFFGYATSRRGEWIDMCRPAAELKPKFLCESR